MSYDRINCHLCEETFKQESRFLNHLSNIHFITDYEEEYVKTKLNGVKPKCSCSDLCDESLRWFGWKRGYTSKFSRGHNARLDSVYLNTDKQIEFAEKRRLGFNSGKYAVWNKGLTKSSSEIVAHSAKKISETLTLLYDTGFSSWQLGLKKDTDERVKNYSDARIRKLHTGEISVWNKGKNKDSDERILNIAKKISDRALETCNSRLTLEEISERVLKHPQFKIVTSLSEYKNRHSRLEFLCTICNTIQEKTLAMLESTPVCHTCHPKESIGQLEIHKFVKTLSPDAILSDRSVISPKELDIWVPSHRLGIEYNGLYWHSEKFLDSSYHVEKHNNAKLSGIDIFSIYDDEWRDKRSIVEGMIRHRLKKPVKVYDARKLTLKFIDQKESRNFFNTSHLEGNAQASTTIALADPENNDIIACMSLRRPFHKKYVGYLEVARCACLPGISVRGWLGKLTSAAKKHAEVIGSKGLITYVDERIGSGSGYSSSGWKYIGKTSSPRFWWTDGRIRHNRFKYKANRILGLTQEQVASTAGVVKIWGLPNQIFLICL